MTAPDEPCVCNLPPLGVMPRWLVAESRLLDLVAAIERYETAGLDVPDEWIAEHNDLVCYLDMRRGTEVTAPDEPCVCGTEFPHDCLAGEHVNRVITLDPFDHNDGEWLWSCDRCGAVVRNADLHLSWHWEIARHWEAA